MEDFDVPFYACTQKLHARYNVKLIQMSFKFKSLTEQKVQRLSKHNVHKRKPSRNIVVSQSGICLLLPGIRSLLPFLLLSSHQDIKKEV